MELEDVRAHIERWVKDSLSVPSPLFNNLPPCPYSREALLKGKVEIRLADARQLAPALLEIGVAWDDSHMLVLLAADKSLVAPSDVARAMVDANLTLESMDLISFFDHPDIEEPAFKVTSTNGKYLLAGIQRLSAFVQAAKPLHKRKYFENVTKQFAADAHFGKGAA